jgi:hypothetical protein
VCGNHAKVCPGDTTTTCPVGAVFRCPTGEEFQDALQDTIDRLQQEGELTIVGTMFDVDYEADLTRLCPPSLLEYFLTINPKSIFEICTSPELQKTEVRNLDRRRSA